MLLERVDRFQFLFHDARWKWSIGERRSFALTGLGDPAEQVLEHGAIGSVGALHRNQQVGEARDGVSIGSRRVGDRNAEVGWHLLNAGRRFGNALDGAFGPIA